VLKRRRKCRREKESMNVGWSKDVVTWNNGFFIG